MHTRVLSLFSCSDMPLAFPWMYGSEIADVGLRSPIAGELVSFFFKKDVFIYLSQANLLCLHYCIQCVFQQHTCMQKRVGDRIGLIVSSFFTVKLFGKI